MTEASPRRLCRLLAVAALVACLGHLVWWYWPRLHRAEPRGLPAELLGAPGLTEAVWIAYPHQNLARLESGAGNVVGLAGHVATLLGGEPPALPRFAFWPVPPARSLTWARSDDGGAEIVALEPYPLVRWLARAAGMLANNPWLAGGPVSDDPAAGQVHWQDGTWLYHRGNVGLSRFLEPSLLTPAERLREAAEKQRSLATPEGVRKALAWLRLSAERPPWPAGLYRLETTDDGIELTHGAAFETRVGEAIRGLREHTVLVAVAGVEGGAGAVALVRPSGSDGDFQLPGAVLVERGDSGLELPGAELLDSIGVRPHERDEQGYRISSWDRGSLALGDELRATLEPGATGAELPRLAVWADVDEVGQWAESLGGALAVVPFIDPQPARRWKAFAQLARAAGPRASLWVEIDASGGAARMALSHAMGPDSGAAD